MLIDVENREPISRIPHRDDFERWCARLPDEDYAAIVEELNAKIDGDEVHTSSWMPGSDWTGTVFQPIYSKACNHDVDAAARFFGLILWVVMQERPDCWAFGRYERDGVLIEGLTYFRVDCP